MKAIYLTKDEIKSIAVLPIGSLEQHGPHLPMGTDTIKSLYIAELVERNYSGGIMILPPIYYGVSIEHSGFPYLGVNYDVFISYVKQVLLSARESGVKCVIVINGHGGNVPALDIVAREINFSLRNFRVINYYLKSTMESDLHAGTEETSTIHVIDQSLIRVNEIPQRSYEIPKGIFSYIGVREASPDGIIVQGKILIDSQLARKAIAQWVKDVEELVEECDRFSKSS
ncbi:creatininase [Sulfolobales archaeon HS-7]|nr:creatininase [Sulfolobales archaeon HS-7]